MSLAWDMGCGMSRPLGLPGGGTVQGLLDSERRRRALELSLAKANRALRDQNLRMMQPQTPHTSPEDWTSQHQMWALKIREFKGTKSNGFSSGVCNAVLYGDLCERIGRLRSELDVLSQKVDQVCQTAGGCRHWGVHWPAPDRLLPVPEGQLPVPDWTLPVGHPGPKLPAASHIALAMDRSQLQRERGGLERLVQDAWARLGVLERDREVLESQVTGLHSELFQTRSREQELQRNGISARAELTGSRQLNDSLLQETVVLRQRLASSEARVALMESERRVLAARLVALETEREQLLSQKALLVRRLWRDPRARHGPPGVPGRDLETDVEGSGREEMVEVVEEEKGWEVTKTRVVNPQRPGNQEIPESLSPVPARPLSSKAETGNQTEDVLQLSEDPEKGLEDTDFQPLKLQVSPEVHERESIEYADWGEVGGAPRNQKDFLSEMEHMRTGEAIGPATHVSGTSREDHDVPQGRSSWLHGGEEETAASKKCNQWDLWKDDPLSANQITALVIELQQLRRASEASWEVSDLAHPGDPQARDWLERVGLLKECVRQMKQCVMFPVEVCEIDEAVCNVPCKSV
ncbi:uncharacterized protein LOC118231129 isoform X1 [Anguilla anguilla]|uniref:uncharacterized protein LOC118231129 isoform X1 n=1 Tax=Anguilla anguilla TaxID=7936 RepID=UPI0015A7AAB8|nr:uncharacterized protein LOC118231129 isoform X1 [Anguilla anguilla]XP_035280553.1 uncharacterized protein LOC118231129 isoform X1 [Anguilla anguilla]